MTDSQNPNLSDPSEQLKAIRKLREMSNQKLTQLDQAINRFITRFDQKKDKLTELYDGTQKHQRYLTNVISTRDALQQTLDLLDTTKRLSPIIDKKNAEENFDEYIRTMNEIGQALEVLSDLNFKEGKVANDKLKKLQNDGREEITQYFFSIINKSAYKEGFPMSYWQIDEKGNFYVEIKIYILYKLLIY